MSLDLLNELEKRVQSAVGTIENLKTEVEQLKEENAALSAEKGAWEGRLAELLGKFDLIDSADNLDIESLEEEADLNEAEDDLDAENNLEAEDDLEAEETLANQAFERDFAEATDDTEDGSLNPNSTSY